MLVIWEVFNWYWGEWCVLIVLLFTFDDDDDDRVLYLVMSFSLFRYFTGQLLFVCFVLFSSWLLLYIIPGTCL